MKFLNNFLKSLKSNFSAIYHSETLFELLDSIKNSNYRLHGCKSFHQTRDGHKVGGLGNFLLNTLSYEIRPDLNINLTQSKMLRNLSQKI